MSRTWLVRSQHALVSNPARRTFPSIANSMTRRSYTDARSPPFTYLLATSSSGKKSKLKPAEHGVTFWTQTHIDQGHAAFSSREEFSGQDAFFMAHIANSRRHVSFGVADGVGGWEESGVNPAAFAHGMCRHMAEGTRRPESEQDIRPVNLMDKGFDMVQADRKIAAGGSTASVATADPTGYMEVANLGDSGFIILSPGKVMYKSKAQTAGFNTPFQLSKYTPQMKRQFAIFGGGGPIQNVPKHSDITHHDLTHGDVVIFGTDGLWDNLSAMEVLEIVAPLMEEAGYWRTQGTVSSVDSEKLRELAVPAKNETETIASRLAYATMKKAKILSHDMKRDGPFAKEVHRYFPGENFHGGKVDDIAVIACIAIQDGPAVKAKL